MSQFDNIDNSKIPSLNNPGKTIKEMRELYRIDPDDENYGVSSFLDPESKLFYDENSKLFYVSKEHFEKHKAFNEVQNISTPEAEPMLSFEEFSFRDLKNRPKYNNFIDYFIDWEVSRKRLYYRRFELENPVIYKSLSDKVSVIMANSKDRWKDLESCDEELYTAYKIFHSYGVSNTELFV